MTFLGGANSAGTAFSLPVGGGTPHGPLLVRRQRRGRSLRQFDSQRLNPLRDDLIRRRERRRDDFRAAPDHPGDANGDGKVDINDLTVVLSNFGRTGCAWSQGSMDGDSTGKVDINDLTIVLSNFGVTYGAGIKAVPEPSIIVLLAIGVIGLLGTPGDGVPEPFR